MTNNNLKMFCLTLEPSHQSIIKEMGYEPVGLGEKIFPEDCFSDKQGNNISKKNKHATYFQRKLCENLGVRYASSC